MTGRGEQFVRNAAVGSRHLEDTRAMKKASLPAPGDQDGRLE